MPAQSFTSIPTRTQDDCPRGLTEPTCLPLQAMAEAMTPDKSAAPTAERQALLRRIAKVAKHQGQFHLACKKYTQVSPGGT